MSSSAAKSEVNGALLKVSGLNAWYGESHVLHGVDFEVYSGEVVTILGRNGAGKTTTMKSVMGIVEKRTGSVMFEGGELIASPSNRIADLKVYSAKVMPLYEAARGKP